MLEKFKGKLIVFEGSDLTGKTTIAKAFVDRLNENGVKAKFTFQPGDTEYGIHGSLFRSMCIDRRWDLHPLTNFFIFFADKVEQSHKIVKPLLEEGVTVVSDRWWYSTYAYQLCGKEISREYGITPELSEWLNNVSVLWQTPDYTFYFPNKLDIKRSKDENDQFETAEDDFFCRVNKGYEELAQRFKFTKINVDVKKGVDFAVDNIISV